MLNSVSSETAWGQPYQEPIYLGNPDEPYEPRYTFVEDWKWSISANSLDVKYVSLGLNRYIPNIKEGNYY